jgi:hypothetical protein
VTATIRTDVGSPVCFATAHGETPWCAGGSWTIPAPDPNTITPYHKRDALCHQTVLRASLAGFVCLFRINGSHIKELQHVATSIA